VLAALAEGETTLRGALWSEDTQVMVECLQELGFMVNLAPDPDEVCNRTITVYGRGGEVPRGGTREQPLELFVGNAGTAARFLAAMVCLGAGWYRLHGVARMHERPQAALFAALRGLGYRVESPNDKLPALIEGGGPHPGAKCRVSIEDSSQFASALLLCAKVGGWQTEVVGENAEESPYVVMTTELSKVFPVHGGEFPIEPDASSGSYFWGASWLLSCHERLRAVELDESPTPNSPGNSFSEIAVRNWPTSGWQIDGRIVEMIFDLERPDPCNPSVFRRVFRFFPRQISRERELGDAILTLIALAGFNALYVRFTDLGRLRLQECDRVTVMRTQLAKCGVRIEEFDDALSVYLSAVQIHGAEIETHDDHRIAMCFAILGLKVLGIKIKDPSCVKKTFPNFFQKLATPPPHGLGVEIRNGNTGDRLNLDELFAD
jgi:3-phosphoshikimate 1-carboxyvinyltransferase